MNKLPTIMDYYKIILEIYKLSIREDLPAEEILEEISGKLGEVLNG